MINFLRMVEPQKIEVSFSKSEQANHLYCSEPNKEELHKILNEIIKEKINHKINREVVKENEIEILKLLDFNFINIDSDFIQFDNNSFIKKEVDMTFYDASNLISEVLIAAIRYIQDQKSTNHYESGMQILECLICILFVSLNQAINESKIQNNTDTLDILHKFIRTSKDWIKTFSKNTTENLVKSCQKKISHLEKMVKIELELPILHAYILKRIDYVLGRLVDRFSKEEFDDEVHELENEIQVLENEIQVLENHPSPIRKQYLKKRYLEHLEVLSKKMNELKTTYWNHQSYWFRFMHTIKSAWEWLMNAGTALLWDKTASGDQAAPTRSRYLQEGERGRDTANALGPCPTESQHQPRCRNKKASC